MKYVPARDLDQLVSFRHFPVWRATPIAARHVRIDLAARRSFKETV